MPPLPYHASPNDHAVFFSMHPSVLRTSRVITAAICVALELNVTFRVFRYKVVHLFL
ncbi:MAG: hypothetical protein ACE5R6_06595 [Candidatus Heimdallarchaeota archaeon]